MLEIVNKDKNFISIPKDWSHLKLLEVTQMHLISEWYMEPVTCKTPELPFAHNEKVIE